jgi:hypothetical protein
MRDFNYEEAAKSCIDNEIVNLLIKIHEKNVRLNCILESEKYDFEDFAKQAKFESIISSNRMEYYYFKEKIIDFILENKKPFLKQEKEVFAYNDILGDIFKAKRPTCIDDFRQLNKNYEEYEYGDDEFDLRHYNRHIDKESKDGHIILEFMPVDFGEVDDYITAISYPSYHAMWNDDVDFLLVMPVCILDFIKIYPLHHNSMQMSRLLMTAMLWAKHYKICKYISIERIIEGTSDEYYAAITESLEHWDDGFNDYKPFVKYILNVILKAFMEFEKRTEYVIIEPKSKPERVEQFIMDADSDVIKRDIMYYCPDISETTIEIALRELKNEGKILKIGGGRYTKYRYNHK